MPVDRRRFIRGASVGVAITLAGCNQSGEQGTDDSGSTGTPVDESTPDPGTEEEYGEIGTISLMGFTKEVYTRYHNMMQVMVPVYERLGLSLEARPAPISVIVDEAVNEHKFQMMTNGYDAKPQRQIDPLFMLRALSSSNADPGGSNLSEYQNPEYDEAFDNYLRTLDQEERKQYLHTMNYLTARDQPMIWTAHPDALAAYHNGHFDNYTPQVGSRPLWNISSMERLTPKGGNDTFILGATIQPETLSIFSTTGGGIAEKVNKIYMDSLTRYDIDGSIRKWLAKDWTIQDDTTVDVTIHEGATFHDGEPLTAEDVAFSYNMYKEWKPGHITSLLEPFESAEALDDHTVRVNLSEPHGSLITLGFYRFKILPKHIWDGVVERENLDHPQQFKKWPDAFIMSGPYEVADVDLSSRIVFERFDDHPVADLDVERLVYDFYGTRAAAAGDLENGQITAMEVMQSSNYDRVSSADNVTGIANPAVTVMAQFVPSWPSEELGELREPFIDPAFRVALANASQKEGVIQRLFDGRGAPAHSIIAPSSPVYNDDIPKTEGGLSKAKQILKDAGYRWDSKGNLLKPVGRMEEITELKMDGPETWWDSAAEYHPLMD